MEILTRDTVICTGSYSFQARVRTPIQDSLNWQVLLKYSPCLLGSQDQVESKKTHLYFWTQEATLQTYKMPVSVVPGMPRIERKLRMSTRLSHRQGPPFFLGPQCLAWCVLGTAWWKEEWTHWRYLKLIGTKQARHLKRRQLISVMSYWCMTQVTICVLISVPKVSFPRTCAAIPEFMQIFSESLAIWPQIVVLIFFLFRYEPQS